jgi:hypothetical protein
MIKEKLKKYRKQMRQIVAINLKIYRLEKENIDTENLRKWKDKLEEITLDLKEMDIALEYLNPKDAYVVREHYINGREWFDIEITYNKTFKDKPKIEADALRKKSDRAIKNLKEFFEPIDALEMECCANV